MWETLGTAFALVLIIEGMTPFLSPTQLRKTLLFVLSQTDNSLHSFGFASMLIGLILLYLIN